MRTVFAAFRHPSSLCAALLLALPALAHSQQLFGCDSSARLFVIDTSSGAGTAFCLLPTSPDPGATEIEYDDVSGTGFVQGRDGVFAGQMFSLADCSASGALVPTGNMVFNGLEFVNGVLYGTAVDNQCLPSRLATLDPTTGASVAIGPTGFGPISGLAWNPGTQTLYGVTGCQQVYGASQLVRIDVATGAATLVGSTNRTLGSLEYGADGILYAGGDSRDGGNLYSVNSATGAATLIGPTGFPSVTGLMVGFRPVPVLVSGFGATPIDDGVRLDWELSADEPVLGFRIYRRDEVTRRTIMLPANGLLAADDRQYVDDDIEKGTEYEYTLAVVLGDGEMLSPGVRTMVPIDAIALHQNTPNPFNPITTISFTLARRGTVTLAIYDVRGRSVATLVNRPLNAGDHAYTWDGKNTAGDGVNSGVYFCRLTSGNQTLTRKMVLLK